MDFHKCHAVGVFVFIPVHSRFLAFLISVRIAAAFPGFPFPVRHAAVSEPCRKFAFAPPATVFHRVENPGAWTFIQDGLDCAHASPSNALINRQRHRRIELFPQFIPFFVSHPCEITRNQRLSWGQFLPVTYFWMM